MGLSGIFSIRLCLKNRKAFFKHNLEIRFLIVLIKLSENNENHKQIIVLNQIKQLYNRKIFKNIEKCVDK